MVDVRAEEDVEALILPHDRLRALMVAEAELGERIMRALILRRVRLLELKGVGPILVGELTQPGMIRLQGFLTRNGQPHTILDPESDPDAAKMIARLSPDADDYPLVVCPDGTILRNPSDQELALCIGLLQESAEPPLYDIAIVGSGPAGPLDRGLCRIRGSVGAGGRDPRLRRQAAPARASRTIWVSRRESRARR